MKSILSLITAGVLTIGMAISAFASNAVIKEDGIRIRSEASTNGTVVKTGTAGEKLEIVESVTGTDGQTWYKVNTSAGTGYVRGDLVTVEQTEETASSQAPTQAEAMSETPAKIIGNAAANIRSGAGKTYNVVTSLDPDTSIVIIGQATDSAGNVWYQLRCDSKNVEGYVRYDLIEISQPIEQLEEEAEAETPENEEPETQEEEIQEVPTAAQNNNDYEVVYAEDADGVYNYYLDDHIKNQRIKVKDILDTLEELKVAYPEATSSLSTYKIIAIVAGVLALAFLGGMIFFIIKSRGVEEEYYDEDDFDDNNTRVNKRAYEDTRAQAVSQPRTAPERTQERVQKPVNQEYYNRRESSNPPVRSTSRPGGRPNGYGQEPPKPAQATATRPRKPQNFLADDDEFEFEFLNMDDKD